MSTPKFNPTTHEKKVRAGSSTRVGMKRTIVLGVKDNRADRTRDVVEGERVSVTIEVREDLQREYRDGYVRDDPDDEEERDETYGEQRDHRLQCEPTVIAVGQLCNWDWAEVKRGDTPCEHAHPVEHPEDRDASAAEMAIKGELERTAQEGVEELPGG
jgi:hypothetical protein